MADAQRSVEPTGPPSARTAGAAGPARPAVRPLDVDGVAAIAVGTVTWGVALVVLLIVRDRLEQAGSGWWVGVAVAGFLLGLLGLGFLVNRRSRLRRSRRRSA